MYAQVEKSKEDKVIAVTNSVTQKKSNGKQGFGFVDNLTRKKDLGWHFNLSNRASVRNERSSIVGNNSGLVQLYTIEPATGNQGGEFVRGNTQIHLHIGIGKNTHLKVEGTSISIVDGSGNIKKEKVQDAYDYLVSFKDYIKNDLQRASNYAQPIEDCKDWLKENGAIEQQQQQQQQEQQAQESSNSNTGYGDFFNMSNMKSNKDVDDDDDFI